MRVPFQLASPPGCHITHIPKGNLVLCTKLTFFVQWHFLLFRPWVFSRGLGCGARRRPAWTLRCKCGPWPRSVARGSSKSRKLASNHGFRFRPPRASQVPCKTRTTVLFIRMNHDDLLFQRRMKRSHSTQHAQDNKDYSTPTWHWTRSSSSVVRQ